MIWILIKNLIPSDMLNIEAKLNPKLFDGFGSLTTGPDVEQVPIRKGFGEGLLAAGEADPNVVGLCADLTESTQMHFFKEKFPNRFIEMGVAEQNLVTVASGMAAMGKIPFVTSYAMFSPGRNWEQIRTTICYNDRPVKIAGSHAGISVGPDGGTHQALEDIALMRVIPRMVVLSPCDAIEAKKATIAAAKNNTPVYIRLAREKTPIITTNETPFEIGKAELFFVPKEGAPSVGIIATGALVHEALRAAEALEQQGISVSVLNLSTIKPLDENVILSLAKDAGAIVTVEEHQKIGGMGSAVAEFLSTHHSVPIECVGVDDQFGQSGTPAELIRHYSLSSAHIEKAVHKVLARK
jgi:transketolase